MKQKVLLMVAFMVMGLGSAIAGNSDYYFKTTVTASGAGKVYASMEAEATPEFQESITLEPEKENARNAPSKTFYLWAEPGEGMETIWSTTSANVTLTPSEVASCTRPAISTGRRCSTSSCENSSAKSTD